MQAIRFFTRPRKSTDFRRNVGCLLFFATFHTATNLKAQSPAAPQAAPASSVPTQAIQVQSGPAQPEPNEKGPIAIVSLDSKDPGSAAIVTGALQVANGRAMIASSGAVTSGAATTEVTLPHRGVLRVCASTTVKLAADASVPAGEVPGLMMSLDHGAIEASFATGRNSDIVITPDFRILIGSPGAADVKLRLGHQGDTCIDNAGVNAPYVLVTSVFDGSIYRVKPGQRVMFQHGSLQEVVDQEKEPCGCPEPPKPNSNEFPLAQSAGLAPLPPPGPPGKVPEDAPSGATGTFVFKSGQAHAEPPPPVPVKATPHKKTKGSKAVVSANDEETTQKKSGFFGRMGHFFRRLFGAE
jgi:hypothetical protein